MTENIAVTPKPGILDISPYVGGESRIAGANRVIKLSSNENPLGPSPVARAAYQEAGADLPVYPDGGHEGLRSAIASVHGMEPDRLVCGAGSDELIALLCQAYAGVGDEVIHTEHGFALYRICALANGATPVQVPESDRRTDVDAILAACTDKTRLVFIANPNNPTGTLVGSAEIARLAAGIPSHALLVLDGAYAEYVRTPDYDAGAALAASAPNVVMTRTFSKAHGLAALRVGWCMGPRDVIDVLNRVRGPFNLSIPALAAAEAAIRDVEHIEHCAVHNAAWRGWLAGELAKSGVPSDPSEANFILARFSDPKTAEDCNQNLNARGVIVRPVASYNLPNCLRITVGDEGACRLVADTIANFMARR